MGSSGGSKNIKYSDVDTHYTEVNPEDFKHMLENDNIWHSGYFQTSNSWKINKALREASQQGISIKEAVAEEFKHRDDEVDEALKTIEAMDRSMRPLNKDTQLIRFADANYLEKLTGSLPEDVQGRLHDAARGFRPFLQSDVDMLRSAILADTVHENAFMSTTYNTTLSDSAFSDRHVRINIDATAGTPVLYSPTGRESECVVNRHEGYGINDVQLSDDMRTLILSVETGY